MPSTLDDIEKGLAYIGTQVIPVATAILSTRFDVLNSIVSGIASKSASTGQAPSQSSGGSGGGASAALAVATGGWSVLGSVIGKVGEQAVSVAYGFGLLDLQLVQMTKGISPGLWVQLDRAMLDLQGAVGYLVLPAVVKLLPFLRLMGDITASLIPITDKAWTFLESKFDGAYKVLYGVGLRIVTTFGALESVGESGFMVLDQILSVLGDITGLKGGMENFGDVVEFVGRVLVTSAVLARKQWEAFRDLLEGKSFRFLDPFGALKETGAAWKEAGQLMDKNKVDKLRDSYGLGGRQASYTGFEEFGKQARISAFQLGKTPEQTAQDKQLRELEKIAKNTEKLERLEPNAVNRPRGVPEPGFGEIDRRKVENRINPPTDANLPK